MSYLSEQYNDSRNWPRFVDECKVAYNCQNSSEYDEDEKELSCDDADRQHRSLHIRMPSVNVDRLSFYGILNRETPYIHPIFRKREISETIYQDLSLAEREEWAMENVSRVVKGVQNMIEVENDLEVQMEAEISDCMRTEDEDRTNLENEYLHVYQEEFAQHSLRQKQRGMALLSEVGILHTTSQAEGSSSEFPNPQKMLSHTYYTVRGWTARRGTVDDAFIQALSNTLLAGVLYDNSPWDFNAFSGQMEYQSEVDVDDETRNLQLDELFKSFENQNRLEALNSLKEAVRYFPEEDPVPTSLQEEIDGKVGWLYLRSGGLTPAQADEWHSRHPLPSPAIQSYVEETDMIWENKGKQVEHPISDLGSGQGGGSDNETVTQVVVSHNPREKGGVRSLLRRGKAFISKGGDKIHHIAPETPRLLQSSIEFDSTCDLVIVFPVLLHYPPEARRPWLPEIEESRVGEPILTILMTLPVLDNDALLDREPHSLRLPPVGYTYTYLGDYGFRCVIPHNYCYGQ
ncbi:hypothetical protein TREMEDRAFT_65595 [Tremella mesenterica DSM 1558]|uniref:uncharacterized protein n=1 Tax=Tremella mesenterica (strain ATCC 24925 / CBS 8224 / DSM 1558 / NBRC 9311 / NRRL Y-6157 / RJB 2259-6 / UBC 559-6) TaxID=578456 RepID=UPI00032C8BD0|nr:uncharacterized protein TREMEDRAFT_65595 [Tremella mesenterica DSM 1558]EIW66323.1 hypothetical protein TREMEDRAFT_65595 [Tremella mesenterica DSM 1558]